jgi:hypothetical protein
MAYRGPLIGDAFGDRFPTQPIAVGRGQVGLVPGDRRRPAPAATGRRTPTAHRHPPPPRRPVAARTEGAFHREPARRTARRARSTTLIVAVVVIAAVTGALGLRSWATPSPSAASDVPARSVPTTSPTTGIPQADDVPQRPPPGKDGRHGDRDGTLGEADGVVPDGVTVFDDDVPAVANLDPALLDALRAAATDAADDRIEFTVNSGWRSPAYQDQLLREAISTYGSAEEAARWVSTADTSLHVSGDAIDIGPAGATAWLSEHGADHGLCQVYRNEPWHFELRPDAVDDGCPPLYADPTRDPRMQR